MLYLLIMAFTNTIYAYDAANRLTSVNGVPYSWGANGNLLNDGVNTYTYNHANRLVGMIDGECTYAFAYNGLGDRLQQTAGGVTTNYTVDLNAGLTQLLAEETSTYLYGVGRIGQQGTEWAYHLPDALGSVRQLADAVGAISVAQSFEPYGEALAAFGSQQTAYGFAGEWTDGTGVMYLRARYYAPEVSRFISRDVWEGDALNPMSYNYWLYAYANPVNLVDPSGQCPDLNGNGKCDSEDISLWRVRTPSQAPVGLNVAEVICELPEELALTPSGAKFYQWYSGVRDNVTAPTNAPPNQTAVAQIAAAIGQPFDCGSFQGSACEFLQMSAKNTSLALTILDNPNSPLWGKLLASGYIGAETYAGVLLIAGGVALGGAAVEAAPGLVSKGLTQAALLCLQNPVCRTLIGAGPLVAKYPTDQGAESTLGHIFSGEAGHFAENTPQNRLLILRAANEGKIFLQDQWSTWYEIFINGVRYWARVADGIIRSGGFGPRP